MMEIVSYLQAQRINRLPFDRRVRWTGAEAESGLGDRPVMQRRNRTGRREGAEGGRLSTEGGRDGTGDSEGTKRTNEERGRKSEVVVPSAVRRCRPRVRPSSRENMA